MLKELEMKKLQEWGVETLINGIRLRGKVGEDEVTTGIVISNDGRTVTTEEGETFELGRVNPYYRDWLRQMGWEYDRKAPIKKGA